MALQYRSATQDGRASDTLICQGCAHIHETGAWPIPVTPMRANRCVNCGGTVRRRCDGCGRTVEEDRAAHYTLAALMATRSLSDAARGAWSEGRVALAMKLASGAMAWESSDSHDMTSIRTVRIRALQALGLEHPAYEDVLRWIDHGGPTDAWRLLADMEATSGNIEGVLSALEGALAAEPGNLATWTDLAEMLAHLDRRDQALQAARSGLSDARLRHRCMDVLADIGERYYHEGDIAQAQRSALTAGAHAQTSASLTWLMARVEAQHGNREAAMSWLEHVLEINPDHSQARAALDEIAPPSQRSQRRWRFLPWG